MNNKAAKKLRKIFNPSKDNPRSVRAYRIAKRQYNAMNVDERTKFLSSLNAIQNSAR